MMPVQIAGIVSVSNSNALTGGYDAETDEAYYERYLLRLQTPPTSGNQYHYRLWALEVTGVGGVQIYPLGHGDKPLLEELRFRQQLLSDEQTGSWWNGSRPISTPAARAWERERPPSALTAM